MWEVKKFNDFIKLNRGFDLPNEKMINGEFPVVASTTIKGFHNQYKVKSPCVVTGRSGSLGIVQYVTKDCWPLNTSLYVKDFKGNFPKYVYYYLQTMHLEIFNSGAGVPTLNQNHLHSVRLKIHNLSTQQRIAKILSVYDDLIENNNLRIELLEQAAQQIYKEWFVRFRFPGNDTATFAKGIPDEWEVVKLGDVVEVGRGSSPRPIADQKYFEGGNIPWIKIADATASKLFITETKQYVNEYGASFSRRLGPGSLILAASGTLGFPIFLGVEGCIHDGWLYFTNFEGISPKYLYYSLVSLTERFNSFSYGAAIQNINTAIVKNTRVALPPLHLQKLFTERIDVIHERIQLLQNQNQNLIKQRDLLLPRLMSGKLEV